MAMSPRSFSQQFHPAALVKKDVKIYTKTGQVIEGKGKRAFLDCLLVETSGVGLGYAGIMYSEISHFEYGEKEVKYTRKQPKEDKESSANIVN